MKVCTVLKDFPYSHTGATTETLTKGSVFECRDDMFAALAKDGYIKAVPPAQSKEALAAAAAAKKVRAIPIPKGVAALSDADRIALAGEILGDDVTDVEVADKIIAAELEIRAAD